MALTPDLDDFHEMAWRLLARGTADRRSAFRCIQIATVAANSTPDVRTVVLRQVDISARSVRFYTDRRAQKFTDLSHNRRLTVHAWDPRSKLQVRIYGTSTLSDVGDGETRRTWDDLSDGARTPFQQAIAPGTPLSADAREAVRDTGPEHFVVVTVEAARLDLLELAAPHHRRASITITRSGSGIPVGVSGHWIAP